MELSFEEREEQEQQLVSVTTFCLQKLTAVLFVFELLQQEG